LLLGRLDNLYFVFLCTEFFQLDWRVNGWAALLDAFRWDRGEVSFIDAESPSLSKERAVSWFTEKEGMDG
jgi:hypothetical protein